MKILLILLFCSCANKQAVEYKSEDNSKKVEQKKEESKLDDKRDEDLEKILEEELDKIFQHTAFTDKGDQKPLELSKEQIREEFKNLQNLFYFSLNVIKGTQFEEKIKQYFRPMADVILKRMRDKNDPENEEDIKMLEELKKFLNN